MKVEVGKTYQHYKNKHNYKVLNFAIHTETGEEMVIYQGLYEAPDLGLNPIFARPKEMFEEVVLLDGEKVDRFSLVP